MQHNNAINDDMFIYLKIAALLRQKRATEALIIKPVRTVRRNAFSVTFNAFDDLSNRNQLIKDL